MSNKIKKVLVCILTFVLIFSMIGCSPKAEENTENSVESSVITDSVTGIVGSIGDKIEETVSDVVEEIESVIQHIPFATVVGVIVRPLKFLKGYTLLCKVSIDLLAGRDPASRLGIDYISAVGVGLQELFLGFQESQGVGTFLFFGHGRIAFVVVV
jgi:hypothetical protein